MTLLQLFCDVDDFCQLFIPAWERELITEGNEHRQRSQASMSASAIMTILIDFHQSHYRDFKAFYQGHVRGHLHQDFANLLSYPRFVRFMPRVLMPLCAYLKSRYEHNTGISYIDSTKIQVCHNKRITKNRVFTQIAPSGQSTMGWFYGFKLHLVLNERGGVLGGKLTPGNVDDRAPVPELMGSLSGKLFGDKGYISQTLRRELLEHGLTLSPPCVKI